MSSELGLGTLKSIAGYIGIRAQLGNPINRKLPKLKKASRRRIKGDLGSLGFTLFFFFSFLFFSFLSFSVVFFRADCFCSFIFFRLFLGSECYR